MTLFTSPKQYINDPQLAHRQGTVEVTVQDANGKPLANTDVVVEQTNHQFLFGNIAFELVDFINKHEVATKEPKTATSTTEKVSTPGADVAERDAETTVEDELETVQTADSTIANNAIENAYERKFIRDWLDLFNMATLPFYWGTFEPEEGKPRTKDFLTASKWLQEKGVLLKGHPLVWHTVAPKWLLGKSKEEVEKLLRGRIRRDVGDFKGIVDFWDAINETVIAPVFVAEENGITPLAHEKGRVGMMHLAFDEARETNPEVILVLNDFDVTTAYEVLIEAALEAGIKIDRLGIQTHQHQGYWGKDRTNDVLNRFARFNIPIHFTETTLLSGDPMPAGIVDLNDYQVEEWPTTPAGEARQADDVEDWYRTLLAHPLVEAITYWGLGDRGMWLNAPGGLVRLDGSVKPSYERLRSLIKGEWWHQPTVIRTDESGRIRVSGWKGAYQVSLPGGGSAAFDITDAAQHTTGSGPTPTITATISK